MATFGPPFVNTTNLADGAVTSAKIALDTIAAVDVAANAIGDSEIAANTTTKITSPFSLVTGTVPIAQGGSGQVAKEAAFDALSPAVTHGDIIFRNSTVNTKLAIGATGTFLKSNGAGADPAWAASSAKSCLAYVSQGAGTSMADSTTYYTAPFATADVTTSSTIPKGVRVPFAGTIKNLYIVKGANQNGNTAVTVQLDGSDTALTANSTGGADYSEIADTSNSFAVTAGQKIRFKIAHPTSTADQPQSISVELLAS